MKLSKLIRTVLLIGSVNALMIVVAIASRPAMATQQASTVYLPIIVNLGNNLEHYWSFNEGSGSIVNDSIQNGQGTIGGDANVWTTGPNNSPAIVFNGDNHVRLDLPNFQPPWTASMWVKRMGTERGMALFSSTTHYVKLEQWSNTGKVGLTEWFGANKTFDYVTPLDEWVHLTLVSTGADVQLFANGLFVDETDFVMPLPLEVLGNNSNEWNEPTIAALDELRVWDVAYSATDVLKLFNATNP